MEEEETRVVDGKGDGIYTYLKLLGDWRILHESELIGPVIYILYLYACRDDG